MSIPAASPTTGVQQSNDHYDVEAVRADFPILAKLMNGKKLVFLDSAASAQKPRQMLAAMQALYEDHYANIHRGIYDFSVRSTDDYDAARARVARFINAGHPGEIVFTRNATEAMNLVAVAWGRTHLKAGDEIIVSAMEHHANIVPWQMLREATGIVLRVAPIKPDGSLDWDIFSKLLNERTKLVAMTHMSNVLGTITPAKEIARAAHAVGAKVLFDGSQFAVHGGADVRAIDADFYTITAHKLYGPNGIGALYAKRDILESMPPYQGGGDMIERVTWEKTTYAAPPNRFEAGTPAIAEAIGFAAALDYMESWGLERIMAHERELLEIATARLSAIPGLTIYGTAPQKGAVISFTIDGLHALDVGALLDRQGIAVRVGQHCAEPLMDFLGVHSTIRASFAMYSTADEVEALAEGLEKARKMLS